jgi:hypothetical protein
LASKQTKMLDNYLTYDLGKYCDHIIDLEKRMWESQKVGKGKTPALRNFFAWHYECKKAKRIYKFRSKIINSRWCGN